MDNAIELAFATEHIKKFLFGIEEKFIKLLETQEKEIKIENLNGYQRLLVHKTAERFHLHSCTQNSSKVHKEPDKEEDKFNPDSEEEKYRTVWVSKKEGSRVPYLLYNDFLEKPDKIEEKKYKLLFRI